MDQVIPLSELNLSDEKIGKGSFGSVQVGEYLGTRVAVKRVHEVEGADLQKYFEREVTTLSASRHPNIVQFMGISKDSDGNNYIVTEYCEGRGDLRHLNETEEVPWIKRVEIALGIARAMAYLHGRGIIHRDIKSDNVLITKDYLPKLCDFGFARPKETRKGWEMTYCGTDWTMAPEIILCTEYTEKADVFSFGMVLGELLSRVRASTRHFVRVIPGFGIDEEEVRSLVQPGCPKELVALMISCVEVESTIRPAFSDVVIKLQASLDSLKKKEGLGAAAALSGSVPPSPVSPSTPVLSVVDQLTQVLNLLDLNTAAPLAPTKTEASEGVYLLCYERPQAGGEGTNADASVKYEYVVENRREHDVRVILRIEGTAAELVPSSMTRAAKTYPHEVNAPLLAVDCLVGAGKTVHLARLRRSASAHEGEAMSFRPVVQVYSAEVSVRRAELGGVTLETRILAQPDLNEVSFYASSVKPVATTVTVDCKAPGGLDPGNDNPLVAVLPANSNIPIFVGRIRTSKPVSFGWTVRSSPSTPSPSQLDEDANKETVTQSNGIRVTTRTNNANSTEIEVFGANSRKNKVTISVTCSSSSTATTATQPQISAEIEPGQAKLLGRIAKPDGARDVVVSFSWKEA